jgi:hypothetical protein
MGCGGSFVLHGGGVAFDHSSLQRVTCPILLKKQTFSNGMYTESSQDLTSCFREYERKH